MLTEPYLLQTTTFGAQLRCSRPGMFWPNLRLIVDIFASYPDNQKVLSKSSPERGPG